MAEKLIHQYDEVIPAPSDFALVDNGDGYYEKAKVENLGSGGGGGGADTTMPVLVDAKMITASMVQCSFAEVVNLTTSGFSFSKAGSAWAINTLTGSSAIWYFQMESNSGPSDALRITYNTVTGNSLDSSGNELSGFTSIPIGNFPASGAGALEGSLFS